MTKIKKMVERILSTAGYTSLNEFYNHLVSILNKKQCFKIKTSRPQDNINQGCDYPLGNVLNLWVTLFYVLGYFLLTNVHGFNPA